jgi:hypothetical protein
VTSARSATDAAFTPSRKAAAVTERRSRGRMDASSATYRNAGRKMPTVAANAPAPPPSR